MTGERFVRPRRAIMIWLLLFGGVVLALTWAHDAIIGLLGGLLVAGFAMHWSWFALVVDDDGLHADSVTGKRRLSIAWGDIRSLEIGAVNRRNARDIDDSGNAESLPYIGEDDGI